MVRSEGSHYEYYGRDGYRGTMQRAVGPCSCLVDEICQTDSSLNRLSRYSHGFDH